MSWLLWPWRTGPATGSELTDSTEPTGAVWCCLATVADGCPSPLLIDDRCVPRRETSILDVSLLLATPYSTYPRVQLGLPRPIHPSALFPVLTPYTSWPVATKKECPASESGYLTVYRGQEHTFCRPSHASFSPDLTRFVQYHTGDARGSARVSVGGDIDQAHVIPGTDYNTSLF